MPYPGPRRSEPPPPLTAARRRVLSVLAPERLPQTLAEVSDAVGGHPNTARQHLERLVADGLVDVTLLPRETRGRRPQGFSVTERGRRALDQTAHEYVGVVQAFAALVAGGPHPVEDALAVGEIWDAQRSTSASAPAAEGLSAADALFETLDMLGFDPLRRDQHDRTSLVLRACPLLGLAERNPAVMCGVHQGMIEGMLRRLGATQQADLVPFSEPHGCRLDLR